MLEKRQLEPWSSQTTDVRTDLHRARHRFEVAADALRDDLDGLRRIARWKDVIRNRPGLSLGLALAAGLTVGALIQRRRSR